MPIIRRIYKIGHGWGISIPSKWKEFYEQESGQKIDEVLIEINENELRVRPYIKKEVILNGQQSD